MKKNIDVMTEEALLEEFENSKKIAASSTSTTSERYHKFAKFIKTNKCKVQGGANNG